MATLLTLGFIATLTGTTRYPDVDEQLSVMHKRISELESTAQYAAAVELAERFVELNAQRDPPSKWWKTSDAKRRLTLLRGFAKLSRDVQVEIAESGKLTAQWRQASRDGEYHRAVELAREQYSIRNRLLGDRHGHTVVSLHILANSLQRAGQLAESELLGRRAVVLQGEVRGRSHPGTLASRQNLALLRHDRGETEVAAREFAEVVVESREGLGPAHPVTLVSTNNYCLALLDLDALDDAATLLENLLPLCIEQGGEESIYTLTTRDNLGLVRHARGQLAEAETMFRHNVESSVALHGANHPYTVTKMEHLARCLRDRAQLDSAESLANDAHRRATASLGADHPQTIRTGRLHAEILYASGNHRAAEKQLRVLAKRFDTARRVVTHRDLERSHFDALNSPHPLLAACLARRGDAMGAWVHLEASFARGLRDEVERRQARPLLPAERVEMLKVMSELDRVEKRLRQLRSTPESESRSEAIATTQADRQTLLARAVALDAQLASRYDGAHAGSASIAQIAATLSKGTALVAWLSLPAAITASGGSSGGEHWAFILLPDGSAHTIALAGSGPSGRWTEEDAQALDDLRTSLRRTDGTSVRGVGLTRKPRSDLSSTLASFNLTARTVSNHFLVPVTKLLAAAGIETIVAVPSGALATIPIECLDDELTVSYVPSGSLYAWLAGRKPATTKGLLAVGDPVALPISPGQRSSLGALPFSRGEIQAIATLNKDSSTILVGERATEPEIARLARTGMLARYRYIHFATHAVVDEVEPLRSALLLSAAPDNDPISRVAAGQEYFDEWLTAREIRQSWKLNAELVTLSACQTGVGSGAGLLSFSEALLTAGARRLVVSQWRVDDRATAFLMHRFYDNLTTRSLEAPEALREARRWLRTLTNTEVAERTAEFTGQAVGPVPADKHPFSHPYYWAGFVLIGR